MEYTFRPMDEASARTALAWCYEAPYDFYNTAPQDRDAAVTALLNPAYAYHAITDAAGTLVGYACFGPDAQVPGGSYPADALDVGWGLHPVVLAQGNEPCVVSAILDFARNRFAPQAFRTTIARFDAAAMQVCEEDGNGHPGDGGVAVAGPEVLMQRAEERGQLQAAVAALAPRQRAMIVLRYYVGCSLGEIAAALDCQPGTVSATLHQALARLRGGLAATRTAADE